jgi:adenosylmethionine-8-amino-7-oxononanoate aminotransferase
LMELPAERRAFPYAAQVGARIARAARKGGVVVRPLADVMVFMPPLSITAAEIDILLEAVFDATCEVLGK